MQGAKLETLKLAATNLISDISGDKDGDTMFSIIPYARYVALDADTYRGSPWLDIMPEVETCATVIHWGNSTGCSTIIKTSEKDGVSYEYEQTTCTNYAYFENCSVDEWDGCVTSRLPPWDSRDYYGSAKISGPTDIWCDDDNPILPLTTSVSDAKDSIASIEVDDETYIPAGLIWGWRALSPLAPLTEANTADKGSRKSALVLMTDGSNTRSTYNTATVPYPYHTGNDAVEADRLTALLCKKIKEDEIELYTVAFQVNDAGTLNMLSLCATDASKFYNATDAAKLKAAFADIGNGFSGGIRLSK